MKSLALPIVAVVGSLVFAAPSLAEDELYRRANQAVASGDTAGALEILEQDSGALRPDSKYLLGYLYMTGAAGQTRAWDGLALIKDSAEQGGALARRYLLKVYVETGDHLGEAQAVAYARSLEGDPDPETQRLVEAVLRPVREAEAAKAQEQAQEQDATSQPCTIEPCGAGQLQPELSQQVTNSGADSGRTLEGASSSAAASAQQSGTTNKDTWLLVAGGGAAVAGWYLLFAGVQCPSCKKRRKSVVIRTVQTGKYVTTRTRTMYSTTERRDKTGNRAGSSVTTRQVPVKVTVYQYDEYRKCEACGHDFVRHIQNEV